MKKRKNKINEFWIDDSTGHYSASRWVSLYLSTVIFPVMLYLQSYGPRDLGRAWEALIVLGGAGILAYGANSASRVWKDRKVDDCEEK